MPGMNGLEFTERALKLDSELEVILITGHGDMDAAIAALRTGIADFITKPFRLEEIQRALVRTRRYVEMKQRMENAEWRSRLANRDLLALYDQPLVGDSPGMHRVLDAIEKIAAYPDTTVLITGKSGTGKELVARAIHGLSARREQRFQPVNTGAIPESLFESQFFGHVRGAFTGAAENHPGWFEASDGGTLFLDEIGEMPASMQVKLLRVLEDGMVCRVGSTREFKVDVRLIAATNRDLRTAVANGSFRADLYHRLDAFRIDIPPLRDRMDDIPLLLSHFTEWHARKLCKPIPEIDSAVIGHLTGYSFPGNVRELSNMVERALILCTGTRLTTSHFPLEPGAVNERDSGSGFDLEALERETIRRALVQAGGNRSRAATLLNLSWQSLDRRLKKHGLEGE
jgi:DNA-binding NtrC family response regulator